MLSACVKASGSFIANIGTNNVVQDFDRIQVALGDKKLTCLAQQDFQNTTNISLHLCDLTEESLLGPGSSDRYNAVLNAVATLPTTYFARGHPATAHDLQELVVSSMYNIEDWANLGIALGDAANGDASTLAALLNYQEYGYPAQMNAQSSITYRLHGEQMYRRRGDYLETG